SLREQVVIDRSGTFTNTLFVTIKNNSPSDAFPAGSYKNYFQTLLPPDAHINKVTENGQVVGGYDLVTERYTRLGFLVTIPPHQTTEIAIQYTLADKLTADQAYQLVVQKQVGAPTSDFTLEILLPNNVK